MSFNFNELEADQDQTATVEKVLEEIKAIDPKFVEIYQTILEPSLKIRLQTTTWPEHRRAYLCKQAFKAYLAKRSDIEAEGQGKYKLDERELEALSQLRDAVYLPDRQFVLSKFGLVGGTQKVQKENPIYIADFKTWKRIPLPIISSLSEISAERKDVFWRFCADRTFPHYEVLTKETISALTSFVMKRIEILFGCGLLVDENDNVQIVEVGAGSGRLSHFLALEIAKRLKERGSNSNRPFPTQKIKVIGCDTIEEKIPVQFPIERCNVHESLITYKPTIVICQWMPLGEDWTNDFRITESVEEYILIGPPEATGHIEKTWRTEFEGWERKEISEIGVYQICRCDKRDSIGHSTTTSFRRTHGIKNEELEEVLLLKSTGNDLFRTLKFSLAREKYIKAMNMLPQTFMKLRHQLALNSCLCFLNEGNAQESRNLSSVVVVENDRNAKGHHILGKSLRLIGDFVNARKELQKALEIEPGNQGTERELGLLEADENSSQSHLETTMNSSIPPSITQ